MELGVVVACLTLHIKVLGKYIPCPIQLLLSKPAGQYVHEIHVDEIDGDTFSFLKKFNIHHTP